MMTQDQFVAAQKTSLETLLGFSAKAFEGFEQIIALNLQVGRTTLAEVAESTMAAMSAKDPQEFMAVQTALLQPSSEKAAAYGKHLTAIATNATADLKKASEAFTADAQAKFTAAIEAAASQAPEGSAPMVTMMKTAIANATSAIESAQKTAKQVSDMTQAHVAGLTQTATQMTKSASKASRSAA